MNKTNDRFEVVIVGAGAAGIGCGVVLKDLGIENFVILERHQVGASLSRWAEEMRFIMPSFPSHGFGLLDLNVVVLNTSFKKIAPLFDSIICRTRSLGYVNSLAGFDWGVSSRSIATLFSYSVNYYARTVSPICLIAVK